MKNLDLLFLKNNNRNIKVSINKKDVVVRINAKEGLFSGTEINLLINVVNSLHAKYGKIKLPVKILLGNIKFIDKLTYIFLECICYYLISCYGHYVQIYMSVEIDIATKGIHSSPLLLLNDTKKTSVEKFPEKFKFDVYKNHYRRLVTYNSELEATNYLGNIYMEIDTFLKTYGIESSCRDEIAQVVIELVGNSCEHAHADCLVDIDVPSSFRKYDGDTYADDNYYYGINIAVINFSNKLLGDDIHRNIINNNKTTQYNKRYSDVCTAYNRHKDQFCENYLYEDFCNITTFQTKISGRYEKFSTGGTGLPKLIKSLESRSEKHRCYVISGNRAVNFYEDYLEYTEDGWIGFNKDNNYLYKKPEEDIVNECLIYMPGTAYNFNFVMKGDKLDG